MPVETGSVPPLAERNDPAAEAMAASPVGKVLVVGGTHGNERNAPWLLEAWANQSRRLESSGLSLCSVIGNPEAFARSRRYRDRDLNRTFQPALLADPTRQEREVVRARHLLAAHGAQGADPCLVAIDLHSTTAAMGNSLVVYGRRPADLALAAALQRQLGLPVYLHEADPNQTGYLVEAWPCGLVIEVGPVPQGCSPPPWFTRVPLPWRSPWHCWREPAGEPCSSPPTSWCIVTARALICLATAMAAPRP